MTNADPDNARIAAVRAGLASLEAGLSVPYEAVRPWLPSWGGAAPSALSHPCAAGAKMTDTPDLTRGSGNLFRDLGLPNPELRQLKAVLAGYGVRVLGDRALTVRQAEAERGVAAGDFSRLRRGQPDRFTVDRLMTILDRLGEKVEVSVTARRRAA